MVGKESEEIVKLPAVDDNHDGGYGWLVVMGAFMVQITSFGMVSSWGKYNLENAYATYLMFYYAGVMQDYFNQNVFANNPSALVDLSFVGTLALISINAGSPIVQVLVARFGLRPVMISGTICIVVALETASLATEVNLENTIKQGKLTED